MENIVQIEKKLWEAADYLRANSKLTSTEYYMPVLGLIFLRHAYNRFLRAEAEIKQHLPSRGGVTRAITKDDFVSKGALFLREHAKFDYLLNLPADKDKGQTISKAMEAIEEDYEALKGVLPKEYHIFDNDLLTNLLKVFNNEALQSANGDVFGRIYEYFLMNFAIEGAQDKGEFFTPVSLVQTIVNIIEPDHGVVLDPACGSGGMFVQTSHFLEESGRQAYQAVTFYGQEKTETTIRLAKMNLAVHGLEGNIVEGNTFYDDKHELFNTCDFVMANPPFNVDKVDSEKIKSDVRLPFGLPGVNKAKEVSNGNYLWISYFYSYLNEQGRAGFVMSSQASSAGNQEKEVRRKLIETGHVDVMVAIGSNFFYTRTVPCELWFFDKGKPEERQDKVLMLDARSIYRKVTRTINDFSPEQLKNITAITWLYRGQTARYLDLIKQYFAAIVREADLLPERMEDFSILLGKYAEKLEAFSEAISASSLDAALKQSYQDAMQEAQTVAIHYREDWTALAGKLADWRKNYSQLPETNQQQLAASEAFAPLATELKALRNKLDAAVKALLRVTDVAEKELDAKKQPAWDAREINRLGKDLDALRQEANEQLKLPRYFYKQIHWLQSRFPEAVLVDVPGLVKLANMSELEQNDWSLTPGRYVGVAPQEVDEDFDFEQAMRDIHVELAELNLEAEKLAAIIQTNFEELGI